MQLFCKCINWKIGTSQKPIREKQAVKKAHNNLHSAACVLDLTVGKFCTGSEICRRLNEKRNFYVKSPMFFCKFSFGIFLAFYSVKRMEIVKIMLKNKKRLAKKVLYAIIRLKGKTKEKTKENIAMDVFQKYGAKAIWSQETTVNQYLCFQGIFSAKADVDVSIYLCSDTNYELYINGHLIGFSQYADYPERKMYDTYDVTKYLKESKNLLSILAYSQGKDSTQRAAGLPMIKFAIVADDKTLLVSDNDIKCRTAKEYRSGEMERISFERPFNMEIDLRGDDGWRERYISEDWQNAVILDDSAVTYQPRPINNLVLHEVCTGKIIAQGKFTSGEGDTPAAQMQYAAMAHRDRWKFFKVEDGVVFPLGENNYWILDLGKETVGYYVLELDAEEGAVIDLAFGEHIDDLRVRSYIGQRNYGFRCTCRAGRQKIACYIHRFAGRYLQIFAHQGIRAVHCAGIHRVEYPVPFVSRLKTGDRLFDKIYQVSMDTLRLCMHEHYEDGPMREQGLYGFDSRNEMLMSYYAFGETAMPKASLTLLAERVWDCGLLNHIAPGSYFRTIPSFSLAWVTALMEYTLFSGDLEFAKEMLPTTRGILDFFAKNQKDGLVVQPAEERYWNFYGWMEGLVNSKNENSGRFDAPASGFFAITLKNYGKLASWLTLPEEEAWAKKKAAEIGEAFHNCFYNQEKGAYQSYVGGKEEPHFAQLTQAVALLADCVPKSHRETIIQAMLDDSLVPVELSYLIYKYDALMQTSKEHAGIVLDDIEDKWGRMLYAGATSFWETSGGADDFGYAGSLCHGWAAVPIYVFWRYMMGVYPKVPGGEMEACPLPSWEKASGELKTQQGIKVF